MTVELISERAGVSVRTFFNYFSSKELAMIATPPPVPSPAVRQVLSRSGLEDLFVDLAELAVSMFTVGGSAPWDFESSIQIVMSVPTLATLQQGALSEREQQKATAEAAEAKLLATIDELKRSRHGVLA